MADATRGWWLGILMHKISKHFNAKEVVMLSILFQPSLVEPEYGPCRRALAIFCRLFRLRHHMGLSSAGSSPSLAEVSWLEGTCYVLLVWMAKEKQGDGSLWCMFTSCAWLLLIAGQRSSTRDLTA